MMLSDNIKLMANGDDVQKVKKLFPEKLEEYEKLWGPVTIRFNMIHYLLKCSYTEDWDREVCENYLSITVEALLDKVPSDYEVVYQEHYVLPYVKQQITKDCDVDLKEPTHFKILLKKREKSRNSTKG